MKKLEKGFTLIELMIVVAIIAILAAVAAPKFGQQLQKAKDAKAVQVVGTWRSAHTLVYTDNGTYATTFGGLASAVDTGTLGKTFSDTNATDNPMTTATNLNVSTAYLVAGTPAIVQFGISGDTIAISTTSTATDGKAWNTK